MENNFFSQTKTVHTARTLMFNELSIIMDYSTDNNNYTEALEQNVSGKRTMKNLSRTNAALKTLYVFDDKFPPFTLFKHFWRISIEGDRKYLALIFAIGMDLLLSDSKDTILAASPGERIESSAIAKLIESRHENKYSVNTCASASRNLISSWKQAGYLSKGKDNVRLKTDPGVHAVAFAFLMSYLNGDRGSFLFQSPWVKVLDCPEQQLRNLIFEASKQELLEYKHSGSVDIISFDNLLGELGHYGVQS
jgi:hypothetical protein